VREETDHKLSVPEDAGKIWLNKKGTPLQGFKGDMTGPLWLLRTGVLGTGYGEQGEKWKILQEATAVIMGMV
jgi:hypothetical protein